MSTLTSKKVSLLSCPFCGSNRVQVVRSFIDSDSNIVHCPHCDACGPRALSTEPEGTAEARWNASRATPETREGCKPTVESAAHRSAGPGCRCADCSIDGEACPTCYGPWDTGDTLTMDERKHWADKPFLRDFFWFLVLPHRLRQWRRRAPLKPTEASFLKDVDKHVMTVLRDDGVHRHLHFAIPGNGNMHFDVVTYPHYLCYSGDMGCYVFSRINDMFEFFRGKQEGPLRINEGYWSEKLEATDKPDGYRAYASELLEAHVNEWLTEVEADDELRERVNDLVLSYSDDGEHAARQALLDFEHEGRRPFQDSWECTFTEYTYRFTWCCYALAWAIRTYDGRPSQQHSEQP